MSYSNVVATYSQVVSDPSVTATIASAATAPYGEARRGQTPQAATCLGRYTKSVDIGVYQDKRSTRYRLHKFVKRLLPNERVATCMSRCGSGGVEIVQSSSGVASYRGVHVCGSVWACPVCSAKIANTRRAELNQLLIWGREAGYMPVMLTLTMRHSWGDALADSLDALKAAKKCLHQSRAWRGFKIHLVGHVTVTEVTYGASGWHPHYHILMLLSCVDEGQAISLVEGMRDTWTHVLAKAGYDCNEYGFQVQGAAGAGNYITKWGPAEEMTLTSAKEARSDGKNGGKGCSPWQMLAYFANGDFSYGALFRTYAMTFHGRRQLVWSRGLKKSVGLLDVDDEDIAEIDDIPLSVLVTVIEKGLWGRIIHLDLRATILEIFEDDGSDALHIYLDGLRRKYGMLSADDYYLRWPGIASPSTYPQQHVSHNMDGN